MVFWLSWIHILSAGIHSAVCIRGHFRTYCDKASPGFISRARAYMNANRIINKWIRQERKRQPSSTFSLEFTVIGQSNVNVCVSINDTPSPFLFFPSQFLYFHSCCIISYQHSTPPWIQHVPSHTSYKCCKRLVDLRSWMGVKNQLSINLQNQ